MKNSIFTFLTAATKRVGSYLGTSANRLYQLFFTRVKVHEEIDYRRAYQFKNTFQPREEVDYEWIRDYARFNYNRLQSTGDTLDGKSESMIRIFAGGSGLISFGAVLKLSEISIEVGICLLVALGLAFVSIYSAAKVRFPRQAFLPPSIFWAIRYAESDKSKAEDKFLAQWHLACEGLRLNNSRKAFGLKVSVVFGVLAILCLALTFGVALATMNPLDTSQAHKELTMTDDPPAAPDPASQPQTVDPTAQGGPSEQAGPQSVENSYDPTAQAGPQNVQESKDPD